MPAHMLVNGVVDPDTGRQAVAAPDYTRNFCRRDLELKLRRPQSCTSSSWSCFDARATSALMALLVVSAVHAQEQGRLKDPYLRILHLQGCCWKHCTRRVVGGALPQEEATLIRLQQNIRQQGNFSEHTMAGPSSLHEGVRENMVRNRYYGGEVDDTPD